MGEPSHHIPHGCDAPGGDDLIMSPSSVTLKSWTCSERGVNTCDWLHQHSALYTCTQSSKGVIFNLCMSHLDRQPIFNLQNSQVLSALHLLILSVTLMFKNESLINIRSHIRTQHRLTFITYWHVIFCSLVQTTVSAGDHVCPSVDSAAVYSIGTGVRVEETLADFLVALQLCRDSAMLRTRG